MRRVTKRETSSTEDQVLRNLLPWAVWIGLPFVALVAWALRVKEGHTWVVPVCIAAVCVALVVWLRKITSERSKTGQGHHTLNILACGLWVAGFSLYGPMHGPVTVRLFAAWAIGGVGLCLAWNFRYGNHATTAQPLFAEKTEKAKAFDLGAFVKGLASRMPALTAPKPVPAIEAPAAAQADAGAKADLVKKPVAAEPDNPADDPKLQREAERIARQFYANFQRLQVKEPKWKDTQLITRKVTPFRASGKFKLPAESAELPSELVGIRDRLAKLNSIGSARLPMRVNSVNFTEVFWDLVIMDTLAKPRDWTPPEVGGSAGERPVLTGYYEDGQPEELMQPAVWKITRMPGGKTKIELVTNLTHLGIEGMPGAGKSNTARIVLAQDCVMDDVEDWTIDCSKGAQTFRPVAPGLEWVVQDIRTARKMVTWTVEKVIKARANYLASSRNRLGRPLDGWVPGCGLPFLRIVIEEAGMIANELGDLYKLFNLARSAGVALTLSLQRAHSGVIDTNVRSAIGSIMSFGFKSMDDAFLLDDELAASGADPGQWKADHPGKHYLAQPGLDMDRQLMVARTLRIDDDEMLAFCTEHGPKHRAMLRQKFPDWYALLESCDDKGLWAGHRSGVDMLADLGEDVTGMAVDLSAFTGRTAAASAGAAATDRPTPGGVATMERDDDFEDDDFEDDLDGFGDDEDEDDDASGVEALLAEIDEELADGDGELSDLEKAQLAEAAEEMMDDPDDFQAEEDDAAAEEAFHTPDPADALDFGERGDVGLPPDQSDAYLHQWLAFNLDRSEDGTFEFTGPSVLYKALGGDTGPIGHGPGWYRTWCRNAVRAGLLEQDSRGEPYRVQVRVKELAPVKPVAPQDGYERDAA
jgi:hypothetical protein